MYSLCKCEGGKTIKTTWKWENIRTWSKLHQLPKLYSNFVSQSFQFVLVSQVCPVRFQIVLWTCFLMSAFLCVSFPWGWTETIWPVTGQTYDTRYIQGYILNNLQFFYIYKIKGKTHEQGISEVYLWETHAVFQFATFPAMCPPHSSFCFGTGLLPCAMRCTSRIARRWVEMSTNYRPGGVFLMWNRPPADFGSSLCTLGKPTTLYRSLSKPTGHLRPRKKFPNPVLNNSCPTQKKIGHRVPP